MNINIIEDLQRRFDDIPISLHAKKAILFSLGIVALDILILLITPLIANFSSYLAVALSWTWFILPGVVLSFVLVERLSWLERIPVSFVISIGLSTPITVGAILARIELNQFLLLQTIILIFALMIFLVYRLRFKKTQEENSSSNLIAELKQFNGVSLVLLVVVILIVGMLAFLALEWPPAGDDVSGLPIFVEVLTFGRITGTEPFHGTEVSSTPRTELMVWTYLDILANRIAGTDPIEFFANSRSLLVILASMATYTFLHQFFKNRRQALFLLSFWGIFLLATIQSDRTGSDLITRILQDKFMGWFVVVPIALVFMLWFLESREWRYLIGFAIVVFGAALVHPITIIQVIMLVGSFGILHLAIERSRRAFWGLIILALILIFSTVVPIIQYIRYTNYMPVDLVGLGDAVEFGRLSAAVGRYRLWLLEGRWYILHPAIFLRPVIVLGFLLLPIIMFQLRKSFAAQLIVSTMILVTLLLYIPPFAALAGLAVTPYLIWRLAWPIPFFAVLTIGWVAWLGATRIEALSMKSKTHAVIRYIAPLSFVALVIIVAWPSINAGLVNYNERRSETNLSTCVMASDAILHLNEIAHEQPVNVLASQRLNFCIPGYAALANVVEFRGLGTINRLSEEMLPESLQRVEDVLYFNVARLIDDLVYEAIIRHDIDYVLVEKDRMELNLQFKYLPSMFDQVYEDTNYSIYAVKKPFSPSRIVAGNQALRLRQFDKAQEIFSQVLREEPENVLAQLGIGLALEGIGEGELAIAAYQKAVRYADNEPVLHAWLASSYLVSRNLEQSIREYEIATELDPERHSLFASLGRMYMLDGQDEKAQVAFERVANLRTVKDTAAYYAVLARMYQSMNRNQEAIQYFEKAIFIEPDAIQYVNLGRALADSGKTSEALEVYQQAIELDRWNYLPHLDLGFLYQIQGKFDEAIKEYEIASRLLPTNISAYILLGQAIQERYGYHEAVETLEEYQKLSRVLPGPHRGLATLHIANGDTEKALQEFDYSANIQPKNAAIQTAKGYLLMANDHVQAAQEAFDQALMLQPELISARLGLSLLYAKEAEFALDTGQSLQVVRLAPSAAWTHLNLAEAYKRQAKWETADAEIEMALGLEPNTVAGYIAAGNLNRSRTRWTDAIANYEKALELEPENAEVMLRLGGVYQALADFAEAEKLYQMALEVNREKPAPYMRLADIYWQQGRFDEATAMEEAAVKAAPDSDLALINLADTYRMQGRIDEAKSLYEQAIQSDPSQVAAYSALAQLVAEADNNPNAIMSLYSTALRANPGSAMTNLSAGKFFILQGQLDQAELVLQSALSFPDVSPENYMTLSELEKQQGKQLAALETLKMAVEVFPVEPSAYQNLANYYLNIGDLDQAEVNFKEAIDLNPAYIPAYVGLSQAAQMEGETDRAKQIFQEAITNNPGSAEAYLGMASFHEKQGNAEQAEKYINQALDINPTDIRSFRSVSQFYLRQGEYEQAYQTLKQALEIPGPKQGIYLDLGNVSSAMDQYDQAIKWYQNAIPLDRSDPSPYLALASLYQSLERWDDAQEALNTALSIQPFNVETHLAMGKLYQRLAHFDIAREYLERAIAIDRSQSNSLIALGELEKNRGNWQAAITNLKQAIETSPMNLAAYIALGQAYELSGDYSQAEAAYSQGIQQGVDSQDAYLARAAFYNAQGNWELAEDDYRNAWHAAPTDLTAGLKYANYLRQRDDFRQALTVLHELEDNLPSAADVMVEMGDTLAAKANWADAMQAYHTAMDMDDSNAAAYIGMARIYEKQGKMVAALSMYRSAVDKSANDLDALINLGDACQSQGEFADAQAAYEQALSLDPENRTALVKLDQLRRKMDETEMDLSRLIVQANTAPTTEALTTLAALYQLRGDWTDAQYWLLKAIELDPYNSDNWFELGNYHRALANWERAIDAYNTALKYEPNSSQILLALGSVQEDAGMVDSALEIYQRAIEVDPGQIDGYQALANLQYDLGQTSLAIETIKEGIARVSADPRGYQTLGEFYIGLNETPQAMETYQAGLELMPGAADLYVSMAVPHTNQLLQVKNELEFAESLELLAKSRVETLEAWKATAVSRRQRRVTELKLADAMENYLAYYRKLEAAQRDYQQSSSDLEAAIAYYQQALDLQPNNEFALIGLGKLELAIGTPEKALKYFEKAAVANPNSIMALSYLGNLYLDHKRTDDAIDVFEQILALDPNNLLAHLGISKAHRNLYRLDISQAAASVEHGQFRLESLVHYFRLVDSGVVVPEAGTTEEVALGGLAKVNQRERERPEREPPQSR